MIDRRQFSLFAAAASLAGVAPSAFAQTQPIEGQHYVTLNPRQPTLDGKRVEVLEFFAYGCSHCFAFEPALDAWQKALPRDVLFRRIPVAFQQGMPVTHQKLFFALEALGLVEKLHRKVFDAIHVEHNHLENAQEVAAFLDKASPADRTRVVQAMDSFAVANKSKLANALASGYAIEGTPSLGIDGRWMTAGSLAGSNPKSLAVASYLVAQAKKPA